MPEEQSVRLQTALIIEGIRCESRSDELIAVVNPSNGQLCHSLPVGSADDVDRAVASARSAFEEGRWTEAPPSLRKRTLHRLADLIEAEASALNLLDAEEMGKPVCEPFASATSAAALVRFYAEAVDKVAGRAHGSDSASLVVDRWMPRGVVAAVTPWNFPTVNAVRKLAPALAAGNAVVHKPSEIATRSAIRLAELALDAGVPPGVLNVVPGAGKVVGDALARHADVDMIAFTGSTAVGKQLLVASGQSNMKTVLAECGGKSPHLIFDDGLDLDAAAVAIAKRLLINQGQVCSVGSRVLVQRSAHRALRDRIALALAEIRMGDALAPETNFGPLASREQMRRVIEAIETAKGQGAELTQGGRQRLQDSGGFFVEPTLFDNVSPTSRLAQEEVFGPVLSLIPFDDETEAVRIANGTIYGLTATVWTTSLDRGMRVAKAIRSSVRVNSGAPTGEGAGAAAAVEPFGQSGIGVEGGLAGMETYLRRQLLWFNHR